MKVNCPRAAYEGLPVGKCVTLRRWAQESADNAKLVVEVVAAFRRSEAKLDFTEAMKLMVLLHDRFPDDVELPFACAATFGHRRA